MICVFRVCSFFEKGRICKTADPTSIINEAAPGGLHNEKVAVFGHPGFVDCACNGVHLLPINWPFGHSAQTNDFYLARQGARFRGLEL
jgi:hypothetical protein